MTDTLEDHQGTVSIGGRTITNLRFPDDINGLAGKEEELASLVDRLDKNLFFLWHGNHCREDETDDRQREWYQHRHQNQRVDEVDSFKYLGAVVTDQGSKPEVLTRIAQTTAALARLNTIWNDKHISLSSKIRLMLFLVISALLYACET